MKALRALLKGPAGLKRFINTYAPFLGAGIHLRELSDDYRFMQVDMHLRWYNKNYVGTHFGGSLYSMVDPFYMLMLLNNLGNDYIVWDKSAQIDFIKPGKGRVTATFNLTDEMLEDVRTATATGDKYLPTWSVEVVDAEGDVVARVNKTLYIRRKR